MKTAISLARVSDVSQKDNSSTASQHNLTRSLAEKRGISVVMELTEQKSGRGMRETIQEAYDHCEKHYNRKTKKNKVQYLLVYDWSRWFRNAQLSGYWVYMFSEIGVEVNAVSEWTDYEKSGDIFLHSIRQAQAQAESIENSKRTRRGLYATTETGKLTCNPPRGVIRIGEEIALHPERGPAYRKAFNLILQGMKPAQVYREVGYRLLGSRTQFYEGIKNPIYGGRYYLGAKLPGQVSKWVILNAIETVISWDDFEEVQRILSGNKSTPTVHDDKFPHKESIFCPDCGGAVTTERAKGGRFLYYRCIPSRGKHFRWALPQAEQLALRIANELTLSPPAIAYLREKAEERIRAGKNGYAHQIGQLRTKLNKASERAAKGLSFFIDGKIGEDAYNSLLSNVTSIEGEITRLEWQRDNAGAVQSKVFEIIETIGQLYPELSGSKKSLFLKMLFPSGFTVTIQKPSEAAKMCRTPRINQLFNLTDSKTALYPSIQIETGLLSAKSPALGAIPDGNRTDIRLFKRFYNAVAV